MLQTLKEMQELQLLTLEEALLVQSIASPNERWLEHLPPPLYRRLWAAWHLMAFDPHRSGAPMH